MFNVGDNVQVTKESFKQKFGQIVKILTAKNSFTQMDEPVYLVRFKDKSVLPVDGSILQA